MDDNNNNELIERDLKKIQELEEIILSAEKTLREAKSMLLGLEGNKNPERKRRITPAEEGVGTIIEGTFDGQIMVGTDGKQYPVPANYASKSKLIEGDLLKLTITSEGSFIYKQIGPAERKKLIGLANQDPEGNYFIIAGGKPYRVLLASITYFKVSPDDEVVLVVPKDTDSDWGAIENVIKKAPDYFKEERKIDIHDLLDDVRKDNQQDISPKHAKGSYSHRSGEETKHDHASIIDEWTPDLDKLKKELSDTDEL